MRDDMVREAVGLYFRAQNINIQMGRTEAELHRYLARLTDEEFHQYMKATLSREEAHIDKSSQTQLSAVTLFVV